MHRYSITAGLGFLLATAVVTVTSPAGAQTNAPAAKSTQSSALFPDEVVAKGKGFEIKRSQLDDAVIGIKAQLAAQNRNLTPDESVAVERQVLDRLIQVRLLLQKATDADRAKARELADKRIADAKAQATSAEAFERRLKASGLDENSLRTKLTEEATAEQVLTRELKVNVTEDQVRKYYDDNPGRFEQPEMVRAAHVLIATRELPSGAELSDEAKKEKYKKAEEVLKKAQAGEDFAKLAKEYSDDTGSKDKGGEYTFPRGQMVAPFEAAAFSLKTNEISGIITTQFGYHIVKVYEKIPAKKVDFAKVAPDLKQYLTMEQIQKLLPDYVKTQREEAKVQILDDSLKPVALPDQPAAPDAKKTSSP